MKGNRFRFMEVPGLLGWLVNGILVFWICRLRAINQSEGEINALASENFGILRLRRQVINENSYVGGIFTSRIGTDGSYNTAYGMDGIFKVSENDYLDIKACTGYGQHLHEIRCYHLIRPELYSTWSRYNQKGLNYNFTYARSGKDFNPGVGFLARNNYTHYYGGVGYGWIPGETSPLQSHQIGINATAILITLIIPLNRSRPG